MNLTWIFLLTCIVASCLEVNGWWWSTNVYRVRCRDCSVGRKKRSVRLSPCGKAYPQKFAEYDLNGNKKITLAEFAAALKCAKEKLSSVFGKTDTNDDGYIDKVEFQFASFNQGQKDHATLKDLKGVGEWVSDAVRYDNKHGLKTVTFTITEEKAKLGLSKLKKLIRKKEEDLFLDEDED